MPLHEKFLSGVARAAAAFFDAKKEKTRSNERVLDYILSVPLPKKTADVIDRVSKVATPGCKRMI